MQSVAAAASLLQRGRLVAFATETVYGLGANALDARAVATIFEVKGRPRFDPLIVHIGDRCWLDRLVTNISDEAEILIQHFWPGALTLVLPKTALVPDLVTSGLSTVAIRMPDHRLALELLTQANLPIAAPSANLFGRLSPTRAEHVAQQLGGKVDMILDGGPCRIGIESTVLQLGDFGARLLRPGGVTVEEIESVIGPVSPASLTVDSAALAATAPGMLPSHYAPQTPLVVATDLATVQQNQPAHLLLSLLAFSPPHVDTARFAAVEVLSATGNGTEAAANFFAALRRLDALGHDLIIAERCPEHGLGRALNDRLWRAAHD